MRWIEDPTPELQASFTVEANYRQNARAAMVIAVQQTVRTAISA